MSRRSLLLASTLVVLAACTPGQDTLGTESITVTMPSEEGITDPVHGKEVWFAVGAVNGGQVPANGLAQAHYFEDGTYTVSLQVNIVPREGTRFEAWILPADGTAPVSMGMLSNPMNDARHQLQFEAKQDLRTATAIEVTREIDGTDPARGAVVATSTLVVRER